MKSWLKRNGSLIGAILVIAIALFSIYNQMQLFIEHRNEFENDFNRIFRWELSGFSFGFMFLIMGITHLLNEKGKKRFAYIFSIIGYSILVIVGLVIMVLFNNNIIDNFGFFSNMGDMLMLIGFPGVMLIADAIRFRNDGKNSVLTEKQTKILLGVAIIVTVLIVVMTTLLIFGVI